ncbi:MAG: hypothetical protein KGJ62_13035 [Armatimonadetes bacterium]|nr:hypothetical protein [Armatimonadota bacterium]MDE2206150.1 hypothetical protein [Armatimonadota bacterium]
MRTTSRRQLIILATAAVLAVAGPVAGAQDTPIPGTVTTLAAQPTSLGSISLLPMGKTAPVTVSVADSSTVGGICQDCLGLQLFKPGQSGSTCKMCGCGQPNAVCVAWGSIKHNTFLDALQSLPFGTVLRLTAADPTASPGVAQKLIIDRSVALLPVSGLSGKSPADLLAAMKSIGITSAELVAGNTQLLLHTKKHWDVGPEKAVAKAIAALGGSLTSLPITAVATGATTAAPAANPTK